MLATNTLTSGRPETITAFAWWTSTKCLDEDKLNVRVSQINENMVFFQSELSEILGHARKVATIGKDFGVALDRLLRATLELFVVDPANLDMKSQLSFISLRTKGGKHFATKPFIGKHRSSSYKLLDRKVNV
ncbi:hypothetical protein CLF_106872 [Clonorchis sinensis]|uniref:Uncharacterized protein n=1 Tax=Clonorchis sinensis TaxID=79923 RepID=G7YFV3_CLOSI|nr:hypothetical protein CLF_106872 [Clonorchis sinensis]